MLPSRPLAADGVDMDSLEKNLKDAVLEMEDMGFTNRSKSLEYLTKTNGDCTHLHD